MAEVTNDLVLETRQRMLERDARMDRKIDDVLTEIRGSNDHQPGFMRSGLAQDSRIADLLAGLERIEARLEIGDQ